MKHLNFLIMIVCTLLGTQRALSQAMVIHMKDGSEKIVFTNQIDSIDFLTDIEPEKGLTGKWHLGWFHAGTTVIQFDGSEYMQFDGNNLEWGGRGDGTENYILTYNDDYSAFRAKSLKNSSKIEDFKIVENTELRIALESGGATRYFYPSKIAAQNADRPFGDEGLLKPDPDHSLTSDINTILSYSHGDTHSNQTPMGAHFRNAHVATTSELEWLADPAKEPSPIAGLTTWKSMAVTLYPYTTPQPADVNQHAIGDCSACAVFASLAYIYPDFIKTIIHDNNDGTYIVDMFDPAGKPVKVGVCNTFLVDGSGAIGQVSGKNNVPTWATVLEKAMIKWEEVYKVDNVEGIGSEFAAPLFTGCGDSFAFTPNTLHASELQQAVMWCLDNGRITIGGFDEANLQCGELYSVTAHAFTLMYPRSEADLFVMRNPWGISAVDGVLDIPDERRISQAIDIRTIEPGAAAPYKRKDLGAYTIPKFSARATDVGVSERVLSRRYLLDLPSAVRERILGPVRKY